MEKELLALFTMQVLGFSIFGRFESHSPWWRSILKWTGTLGIVWIITLFYGHTVSLFFILGMFVISIGVHFLWCYKNKIHPIMATPKRRYYELRGWKWEE